MLAFDRDDSHLHMNSFLSKFKAFPEFTLYVEQFAKVRNAEGRVIEGMTKAFSQSFVKYATTQMGGNNGSLTRINIAGTNQITIVTRDHQATAKFASEVQPLKVLHDEREEIVNSYNAATVQAEKNRLTATKASDNLSRMMNSGRSDAVMKAEQTAKLHQQKADESDRLVQELSQKKEDSDRAYSAKFAATLAPPLIKVLDVKIRTAKELIAIADEIDSAADAFEDFEDRTIKTLRESFEEAVKDNE